MPRPVANALMLLAGLFWGGGFIAQETAMRDIGPFLFVGTRFVIATLAIAPFMLREMRTARPLAPGDIRSMLVVGGFFFTAMMLQQIGLLATSVTNAGVLTGLYVVLVPLIAFLVLGMQQPAIVWPCAALAFVGVWFLGGGGLESFTWGDGIILVSAVFAALHVLAVDWSVRRHNRPVTMAVTQFAACAVGGFAGFFVARAIGWASEPPFSLPTLINAAPEIAYAALIAGALAFTIMAVCQQYTAPATAAILLSSESLFAAAGGAVLLGERLSPLGYLGCGLLFTAICMVSLASARAELREA